MDEPPPDWPLSSSPVPYNTHSSNDSFISLYRHDSSQLTLHDYHKFQQSPVLATPPEFDLRRLRRKPSTPDLSASPLASSGPWSHWSPSAILPRQTHSLQHHTHSPSAFSAPPLTPRLRPSTTSPSLTSTVTTLQSTPARTPIYRAAVLQEQAWDEDYSDRCEPIRTKRKFEPLRRAKRLPRQRADSSESGAGQEELWEVYAAVFDPPLDERLFRAQTRSTEEQEQVAQQHNNSQEHNSSVSEQVIGGRSNNEPSAESRHTERGDPTVTSSLSLSKFDFPKPPPQENWEGTLGHLVARSQSSTPATIHYHGASFDVVNPHASLILGARHIETPAEIDGLLDDYFDHPEERMQYDSLTGEPSQVSLRIPSESSRRILYDDPSAARRKILRVEDNLPSPPASAVLNDMRSPRAQKMSAAAWQMAMVAGSHRSDPFDLTLSESGSNNQLNAIDGVLRQARNAEVAQASPAEVHGLGITEPDHGADTQATLEPSTDPTIREILNAYEYTRAPISPTEEVDITDSPAIERARKLSSDPTYETSHGLISPLQTPAVGRKDSAQDFDPLAKQTGFVTAALPTPPAPVYTGPGLHFYPDCSEFPTTDRTYGETNQLLLITPENAPVYSPNSPETPCNPKTCGDPAHIHIRPDQWQNTPVTPHVIPWYHDNKENIPPKDDHSLIQLAAAADRFRFFDDDDDDGGDLARCLHRSSSFYPDDIEDDWETQYSDSYHDLPRRTSHVISNSHAKTSFHGSQVRLSRGPQHLKEQPLPPIADCSPLRDYGQATCVPDMVAAKEFERRCQIKKAIKELEAKIVDDNLNVHYGMLQSNKTQRKADFEELERLRQLYPSTSDRFALQASESLMSLKAKTANKLQKVKMFRPQYNPRNSFNRIAALGMGKAQSDVASDYRALLDSPSTPSPRSGELQWNEAAGTFTTLRGDFTVGKSSPVSHRGAATELWSPFVQDPTVKAIYGGSQSNSATTTKAKINEIELQPLGAKSKRYKPPAMSNQYEPRELHLLKSKRLTDAQLVARQPGWRLRPQVAANSPLGKHNEWSFAAHEPMLISPESDVEKALRADQEALSKRYLWLCAAFPPLTFAFGLGVFDSAIKRKVGGHIKGASRQGKRDALLIYFPLGTIFWTILIISLWLMVLSSQGGLIQRDKNSGSPLTGQVG